RGNLPSVSWSSDVWRQGHDERMAQGHVTPMGRPGVTSGMVSTRSSAVGTPLTGRVHSPQVGRRPTMSNHSDARDADAAGPPACGERASYSETAHEETAHAEVADGGNDDVLARLHATARPGLRGRRAPR